MAEIKYIPVSKLWGHPDNPRKDLGDVTELAESIKANGTGFAPHWGSCRAAGSFKSREEHNG